MSSSSAESHVDPSGLGPVESGTGERCDACEKHSIDVFFCNVCGPLCSGCWAGQVSHKKARLAPGAIPHEKTDPWVAKQVQKVLSPMSDEFAYQKQYLEDEETAWFGESDASCEVLI